MKKLATILVALAAIASLAAPASATQFWLETFSYANGGLATVGAGNGWNTFSGTGTDVTVTSGVAVGLNSNAPDDQRSFPARGATDKTYACTQVTIPAPATTPIVGNYFEFFKDPVNTGTTTAFVARVFALPIVGDPGHFNFGIGVSGVNTTTAPPAVFPMVCSFGTRYNVVFNYDAGAGSATLWVNPSSETSTNVVSTLTTSPNAVGALINNFSLRQSNSGSPATGTVSWGYNVDNVGVGTTMADACVGSVTKTQGATWGTLRKTYR